MVKRFAANCSVQSSIIIALWKVTEAPLVIPQACISISSFLHLSSGLYASPKNAKSVLGGTLSVSTALDAYANSVTSWRENAEQTA